MKRTITLFFVGLVMTILSIPAMAWDGTVATSYAGGTGTSGDPYLISSAEELAYLAQEVNASTTYAGIYFELTADIDLSGNNWTPIGSAGGTSFRGVFDGNNHTVSNMYILTTNKERNGLFGYIYENSSTTPCLIKNLGVKDFSISINTNNLIRLTGGLVGSMDGAYYTTKVQIENCYTTGTINISGITSNTPDQIGGLTGRSKGPITDCYARVNINITAGNLTKNHSITQVNTFAGHTSSRNISNCYNTGAVTIDNGTNTTYSITNTGTDFANVYYGIMTNCYTSEGSNVSSGITYKTETELKNAIIPVLLGTTWIEDATTINDGFPVLSWQTDPNKPVATTATSFTESSFTANWGAVSGATKYYIDVATDVDFTSIVTGYDDFEVASGTSQSVTGLTNSNTSYFYRVRSFDGATTSANSNTILAITTPVVPTADAATNVHTTYYNFNWTMSSTGDQDITYTIQRADDAAFTVGMIERTVVDVLTREYTSLASNTKYYFRVKAANSTSTSAWSETFTATTLSNPANLNTASYVTATSFQSNWTAPSNVGSEDITYFVEKATLSDFSNKTLTGTTTDLFRTSSEMNSNTTYYWRTAVTNAGGNSYPAGYETTTTLPAAPTSSSASNISNIGITANWTAPTQGDAAFTYTVEYGTSSDLSSGTTLIENITSTNLSQSIGSLTPETTYYYRVKAVNTSGSGAWSDIQSATTPNNTVSFTSAGTSNWSTESNWAYTPTASTDLTVESGELVIDASATVNSITVNPGAKLTIESGSSLTQMSPMTLKSDATGTATFVDENDDTNSDDLNANVELYLPANSTRTWWYLASPVSGGDYTVFGSNLVGDYNEPTLSYSDAYSSSTELTAGKGYVVKMTNTSVDTYIFSNKTLNTGDVTVGLTRTGNTEGKRGFNLVGNPYPSYLNWDLAYASASNVRPTIWYRTGSGASMSFETYNANTQVGSPAAATKYIPPMQAFWARVDSDPATGETSTGTLNLTNAMRLHDQSAGSNPLKAPALQNSIIRLTVSNGVLSDETVIASRESASDSFDLYDSEKMSNNDENRAEIYCLVDNHELVINGVNTLSAGKQFALGLRPGKSGLYSIATSALSIPSNLELVLRDNNEEIDYVLTGDNAYEFSASNETTNSRFTVRLRAKGTVTDVDTQQNLQFAAYQNEAGGITVLSNVGNSQIKVYNLMGRELINTQSTGNTTVIDQKLQAGIYMIKMSDKIIKLQIK